MKYQAIGPLHRVSGGSGTLRYRSVTVRLPAGTESWLQGICTSNTQARHGGQQICTLARPPPRHCGGTVPFECGATSAGTEQCRAACEELTAETCAHLHGWALATLKFAGGSPG